MYITYFSRINLMMLLPRYHNNQFALVYLVGNKDIFIHHPIKCHDYRQLYISEFYLAGEHRQDRGNHFCSCMIVYKIYIYHWFPIHWWSMSAHMSIIPIQFFIINLRGKNMLFKLICLERPSFLQDYWHSQICI